MSFPTVVFDDGKGLLSPLTDLRAAFDIRTGMCTTLERYKEWLNVVGLIVPPPLIDITRERHASPDHAQQRRLLVNDPELFNPMRGPLLLLSGRAPLGANLVTDLRIGQVLREPATGDIVAAVCSPSQAAAIAASGWSNIGDLTQILLPGLPAEQRLQLSRPWHIRTFRNVCMKADLDWHAPRRMKDIGWPELTPGTLCMGTDHLAISKDANVCAGTFFDTSQGPIIVDDDAVIRPGAIVCGPAYIGMHSHVLDRCLIKPHTAIGPHCKVAGEIGGTIFQGFANKAHDGHLGDSYIGEWANLGAGTTNSNLLNTYGEVIARPFDSDGTPAGNERSGEQFLGCIIGDHAKFAICTRLMTGAIVGTGTMWAATQPVTGTIHRLRWVTDAGVKPFALPKFLEVAATVMGRRHVSMSTAYRTLIARLAEQRD